MSESRFEYKCRRCGEIEASTCGGTKLVYNTMMSMVIGLPMPDTSGGITPEMLDTHACKDGGMGISDFIGITKWRE